MTTGTYPSVRVTRTIAAERDLVFQMWTSASHVTHWWGPHGFTNPRCAWEARPGGSFFIEMRSPDGTIFPAAGRFLEVSAPERLVFTAAALDDKEQPIFEVLTTVTLSAAGGKTIVTVDAVVTMATAAAAQYLSGMEAGWSQSLQKLEALAAAEMSDPAREIVTQRLVAAPRELLWRAWTEPAHLANWWGPQGFRNTIHEHDLRPGGNWRFTMHGPDGRDWENHSVYVEVAEPERIVFDHLSQHRFRVIATFAAEADKTRVRFCMRFEDAGACERSREFVPAKNEENFDRLEEELARMR